MLGWLRPKCPLGTGEKMWTEYRMRWLAGKLGLDRLINAEVILPDPRFFPDPYTGTHDDARRIFVRVCGYMQLDPMRFDLEIFPTDVIEGAAGVYYEGERPRIALSESQLTDPERLVATIAHELGHDILLGGGLISIDEGDHELVTDLLPICLGMGLFTANAPVRERSYSENIRHYFHINRQGYLPSHILGYALALFAYARGEAKPVWARHLRPDARQPLKQGLRYLLKTGDSLFRPDNARQPVIRPSETEVIERLATGSPTVRAMTLCEMMAIDPPASLVDAVAGHLRDVDVDVQIEAARVLPLFGELARDAVPDLIWCLTSRSAALRSYAAVALTVVGASADQAVPELSQLLRDPDPTVVDTAATELRKFASSAGAAVPALIDAIRMREISGGLSDTAAATVIAINPPAGDLDGLLDLIDPELRRLVIRSLRLARLRQSNRKLPN